jgi:hypothetical protein
MFRLLGLVVLILFCAGLPAQAVEMFTDFHYGENVGFPPMQVPYGIYGGLGRGGWNPYAEGMPLKSMPPVHSMMPTGQVPGGFRRLNKGVTNNGKAGRVNEAKATKESTSGTASVNEGSSNASAEESGPAQPDVMQQLSSRRLRDRDEVTQIAANPRRRWQRGNGTANNYIPDNTNFTNNNYAQPNRAISNNTNVDEAKFKPAPTSKPTTTVLRAGEGKAPSFDLKPED